MHSNLTNSQPIFVTAGYDNTIRFWEVTTGHCYRVLQHNDGQVNCMAIYPEKTLLATGGYQQIQLYDTMSNNTQSLFNFEGILKNTNAIGFSNTGSFMYSAGEDKHVKLWDMRARQINSYLSFANEHSINCAVLHPNQVDFIIGDDDGNLIRWDIRSNQAVNLINEPNNAQADADVNNTNQVPETKSPIRSVSISQEGDMFAATNNDGQLSLWHLSSFGKTSALTLGRKQSKKAHERYALKCLFSPDSTLLATSGADGYIKIWQTNNLSLSAEHKTNKNQSLWVWDLAFTCDSEFLFSVSSDKMARLLTIPNCTIKREFNGHQKPLTCLALNDFKI